MPLDSTPPYWDYLGLLSDEGNKLPIPGLWFTEMVKCGPAHGALLKDQSKTHAPRLLIRGHLFILREEE